jgi:DNA mismatch repair protein MutS2
LATTHLEAVKAFVAQDLRMTNAAMEFDLDSLRPVYKLQIGLPGQSFAIDVACRLGIPPTIIQRSRELLGDTGAELQALLDRLQALERQRAGDASEAAQELAAAVASREAAGRLTDALREQAAVLRTQARRIVADIAAEARRRAEAIASELASGGSLREAREAIRHIPQAAERQLEEIPIREVGGEGEPALTGVEPGQRVWIRHLAQAGTVVSGPTGQGLVEVQLPLGKARVRLEGLAPAAPAAAPASGGIGWTAGAGDALGIEINVIGCTVEEAWARVERFVEDAVLGGLQRVRIVHGKGTGRLRRGLTALLKAHPLVAGCHLASFEEGGAGATIVDLGSEDGERVATGREGADRPHRIE